MSAVHAISACVGCVRVDRCYGHSAGLREGITGHVGYEQVQDRNAIPMEAIRAVAMHSVVIIVRCYEKVVYIAIGLCSAPEIGLRSPSHYYICSSRELA